MSEVEFLAHKEAYIRDVLTILEKRAEEEAGLIFARRRQDTAARPELADQPLFRKVILSHLPVFVRKEERFRRRVKQLPQR